MFRRNLHKFGMAKKSSRWRDHLPSTLLDEGRLHLGRAANQTLGLFSTSKNTNKHKQNYTPNEPLVQNKTNQNPRHGNRVTTAKSESRNPCHEQKQALLKVIPNINSRNTPQPPAGLHGMAWQFQDGLCAFGSIFPGWYGPFPKGIANQNSSFLSKIVNWCFGGPVVGICVGISLWIRDCYWSGIPRFESQTTGTKIAIHV